MFHFSEKFVRFLVFCWNVNCVENVKNNKLAGHLIRPWLEMIFLTWGNKYCLWDQWQKYWNYLFIGTRRKRCSMLMFSHLFFSFVVRFCDVISCLKFKRWLLRKVCGGKFLEKNLLRKKTVKFILLWITANSANHRQIINLTSLCCLFILQNCVIVLEIVCLKEGKFLI